MAHPGGRPKGIWTPDIVRKRIQATKLADRLQDHALGKLEMTKTQIMAATVLLQKSVPDLQSTELTGPGGGGVEINVTRYGSGS